MSLFGFHCRKGIIPDLDYWYTVNYENGCRADKGVYRGDVNMLFALASRISAERGREVHIRKNWTQGNDTHYMTVSVHRDGRKIR